MKKCLENYVRLVRDSTTSFMTFKLPKTMTSRESNKYVRKNLPGWDVICGSFDNPDEEEK